MAEWEWRIKLMDIRGQGFEEAGVGGPFPCSPVKLLPG